MAENRADLVIRGLASERDVEEIREALEEVDGVLSIEIDPDTGEAEIDYDYDILSEERIKRTIRNAGYELE